MGKVITKFAILGLILSSLGCVPKAYLYAEKDIDFRLHKIQTIFVYAGDSISVAEKNLRKILIREMKTAGLKVVNEIRAADLVLSYSTKKMLTLGYSTTYLPTTGTTVGFINGKPYSVTTTGYRAVPYPYTLPLESLHVVLYERSSFVVDKRSPVWEGFITVEKNQYNKKMRKVIEKLVQHLGKNYDGRISVD